MANEWPALVLETLGDKQIIELFQDLILLCDPKHPQEDTRIETKVEEIKSFLTSCVFFQGARTSLKMSLREAAELLLPSKEQV